jgi:predicted nucleic acid-binding protein
MDDPEILVLDTGPLIHFAKSGWLGPLRHVIASRTALVPDIVMQELTTAAARDGRVRPVLNLEWLSFRELSSDGEMLAFAHFASFVVRGKRNRGEAGVLALASTTGGEAVLDDGAARRIAKDEGIPFTGTSGLLCGSIRKGFPTLAAASALADDLLNSHYRLPFQQGEFEKWSRENGPSLDIRPAPAPGPGPPCPAATGRRGGGRLRVGL